MKRRLEQQVFYRRLMVRIRRFGWTLRVTPEGAWVLRHPKGGLIIRPHQPRSKNACYRIAKEMRAQEKAMRKNGGKPWDGSATRSNGHSLTGLEPITAETRLKLWPMPPYVGSAARSMATS